MHPRTRELLEHLETHFRSLQQTVEGVPREARDRKSLADCWCVSEILEHLAIVEGAIERLLARKFAELRSASALETETSPVAGRLDMRRLLDRTRRVTAGDSARPTGSLDADAAWAALVRAHDRLVDTVRASDGLALGAVAQPHPALGPLDLYQWVLFVGGHEARHAAQIREVAAS